MNMNMVTSEHNQVEGIQMKTWRTQGMALLLGVMVSLSGHAATDTRKSGFVYDANSGLLIKEIIEPNDPNLCLVTEYAYDAYGNKTSVTTRNCNGSTGEAAAPAASSPAVITPRTTTTVYDGRGQFATKTTNALGHTETRTFDERFGAVDGLTGPNGLQTTWVYDGFGRKRFETRADGTQTEWKYLNSCGLANPNIVNERYCVATLSSGQGRYTHSYYDALNRKLVTTHRNFDDTDWVDAERVVYNALGQVVRSYRPYSWSSVIYADIATVTYDLIGRPLTETTPIEKDLESTVTHEYNGLIKKDINSLGQTKITTSNVIGQTVSVTDALGKVLRYTYDPFGNLTQTTDPLGNVTTLTYDGRGRKIKMDDPDMGVWKYFYDALGQLIRQDDAKGQTVTMTYDKLGRMLRRDEPDLSSIWEYDELRDRLGGVPANGKQIGKLVRATSDNGYGRIHTYDHLGRLIRTQTTIGGTVVNRPAPYSGFVAIGTPLVTSTTYDNAGRPLAQTYPTGFAVRNIYNGVGTLMQVANDNNVSQVYWSLDSMDAAGRVRQQTYGNGVVTQQRYDAGRLVQQIAGVVGNNVQNMSYSYDSLGNLLSRTDHVIGVSEGFSYDDLNRVTDATVSSTINGVVTINVSNFAYNALGNITSKTGTGTYAYNASGATSVRPHAVARITGTVNGVVDPAFVYDANGNMMTGAGRTITWTSFNIPSTINSCFGNVCKSTSFLYNPEHERTIENQADGSQVVTLSPRYDTGLHFEKKSNFSIKDPKTGVLIPAIEYEHYLYAGGQMFGKYITTTTLAGGPVLASDGTVLAPPTYEYYTKDHLGSIVAITGPAGGVMQRLSYDVWGKRRSPNGAADPNGLLNKSDMYHGYTGHEMLDDVGLIHMNGRLYDPMMARFVSADFLVQAPDNLQSYNRYSYGWNNPMAGTDPSGQVFVIDDILIGAAIGALISGAQSNWDPQAMIVGGMLGAVGGATFQLAGGGLAGSMASGAVVGGIGAGLSGGDIAQGMAFGALAGALTYGGGSLGGQFGEVGQFIGTGVGSGLANKLSGGSFSKGVTYAFLAQAVALGYDRMVSGEEVAGGGGGGARPDSQFERGSDNELLYSDDVKGSFCGPNVTCKNTGAYHERRGQRGGVDIFHKGADYTAHDPITDAKINDAKAYAAVSGKVTRVGQQQGFGPNTVRVQTESGTTFVYGHMREALVVKGQAVTPETPVGVMGNMGGDFQIHLHVEATRINYPIFIGPFIGVR